MFCFLGRMPRRGDLRQGIISEFCALQAIGHTGRVSGGILPSYPRAAARKLTPS
ncbi:hypothetical protein ACFOEY_07835 [Paracandidimonas soli]|uniref:hypothetical protein n=1 Tax=Paracandidimonas soli TaxID=1917182 RepID=UPI00362079B9